MENTNEIIRNQAPSRRKRVKRLKVMIVTILLVLLILPCICCMFLLYKVNQLESQINLLTQMHHSEYELYSEKKDVLAKGNVVYAAEEDKTEDTTSEKDDIATEENDNQAIDNSDSQTENNENSSNQKKVFLTFDDGPSEYTDEILDVLKQYNVKATFFVIGKTDEKSKELYKRIVNEGHTLGMHSYSHKYDIIYNSVEDFKKDFTMLSDLLYDTTGVRPKFYRFPGGSSNTVSKLPMTKFISVLKEQNIIYYDWNVENGDATGKKYTAKQLASNIMKGVEKHNTSIVLMHDTVVKGTTVKSLSKLIQQLQKEKYLILPIEEENIPIQHIKSEDIVN